MEHAQQLGQEALTRFTPSAADAMVREIEATGGREVFFAGTLGAEERIDEVRVCARGHEGGVPALQESVRAGEVVIHNHPSGHIAPSEADLRVAALFGFHGHGVYIVDNAVSRVYVVVEPFTDAPKTRLDPDGLAGHFTPNGALAQALPGYEVRPQQVRMMEAVVRAFNHDALAVIEAPTGVGKTMAYLLPAVLWAIRNKERVVISTNTINLQEQIIQKDIPLLRRVIGEPFNAVLVKGKGNYLCLRKLHGALSEATLFEDEEARQSLNAIEEWSRRTEDGSLADLPFVPGREVWSKVCSESDTCSYAHCPSPRKCFVGRARRDVAKAEILVVNHHMLFSDLAIKKEIGNFSSLAVLPSYNRLILDEAHNVEDAATDYFGATVTRLGAIALLGRFVRAERNQERGLLPFIKRQLAKESGWISSERIDPILDIIDNEALPAFAAAREGLLTAFAALRSHIAEHCKQVGREIRWRLTEAVLQNADLREIHNVYVIPACEEVSRCAAASQRLARHLRRLPAPPDNEEEPLLASERLQLEGYTDRLNRLAVNFLAMTNRSLESNTVRWAEIDAENEHVLRLARCPLEVGPNLAEWVYDNLNTVVMTSATLTVKNNFSFFHQRTGVDRVQVRPTEDVILESPFDFQRQALLGLPDDLPRPDAPGFLEASTAAIEDVVAIAGGGAFVLFTSYYALDFAYKRLERVLRDKGMLPLRQGAQNRSHLLDKFRENRGSVLFATDSFWEGVDVAGEALQCVILPKLPFRVPTEPVFEARVEAVEAQGGNSFMDYTAPQAVIRFRQGFGRLIRRRDDRGAIVVLDNRVVTKRYGRMFLESLPGVRTVRGPAKAVMQALNRFFKQTEE